MSSSLVSFPISLKETPLAHPLLQVCWWWNLLAIINFYTVKCLHFSIILYRCLAVNTILGSKVFAFFSSNCLRCYYTACTISICCQRCFRTVAYLIESIIVFQCFETIFFEFSSSLCFGLGLLFFFFSFLSCQLFCEPWNLPIYVSHQIGKFSAIIPVNMIFFLPHCLSLVQKSLVAYES